MLQVPVVQAIVHGIFIRPFELEIWFYTTHLTNFSIRSRRWMEWYTRATMLQHASRTAEAAEVAISIRPCHTTRFWCGKMSHLLHQHWFYPGIIQLNLRVMIFWLRRSRPCRRRAPVYTPVHIIAPFSRCKKYYSAVLTSSNTAVL